MITIFTYHKILKELSKQQDVYDIQYDYFIKQLSYLKNKSKICTLLDEKQNNYDKNKITVLTFDDGTYDHYSSVFKELEYLNLKGVFYVNPCNIGNKNYLSKKNICEMVRYGHEIGSHSYNHLNLAKISKKNLLYEIQNSKAYLEDLLGIEILSIAPPFGSVNDTVIKVALDSGYKFIRTTKWGHNKSLSSTLNSFVVKKEWDKDVIERIFNKNFFIGYSLKKYLISFLGFEKFNLIKKYLPIRGPF